MPRRHAAWLCAVLTAAACSKGDGESPGTSTSRERAECVDRDGDGYGDHCDAGPDCDDDNPEATTQCTRCAVPERGCACELGSLPVTCFLDKTESDDGEVMCNEGTRYCRNSRWSSCEDVHTYPLAQRQTEMAALIDPDAGAVQCNDCSVNCFRISDNLDPIDGGLGDNNSNGTAFVPGGGLTLGTLPLDASIDTGPPYDPSTCMLGTAPDIDCDGIPDEFDPFPNDPPFATANPGIFLGIGPGETGTGVINLEFFINSADVYFLVDQSASMAEERDNLKAGLISGDFINDPNFNCADVNLNRLPDDNHLKDKGIVGAINCIIRNAAFGVGYHREIPFPDYADNKQIAFENYRDITSNVDDVLSAINRLTTIGNIDWPEASMLALNTVVTGNQMYFGTTKRGIPPRIDCPAGTWGYPCFRESSIPIVVLFTDAMMHNGPDNNNYPYNASRLGITRGSSPEYFPVPRTNETFATAYNAGDLTSLVKTFTGNSSTMVSNITRDDLSCLSQNGGSDAFFRFDLTQTRTVRISSEGSHYDTVLGLYAGQPQPPTVLPPSSNTNETPALATNLGFITGGSVSITGNTSGMAPHHDWSTVQCNADPSARDAVYRFDISSPTNVELSTVGSSFDTVLSLHDGPPPLAPTYTPSSNTNEVLESAEMLGEAYKSVLARSGNTTGLISNYLGAEVGCGADNTSPDVVHRFTLAQPTRVRISTEGSAYDTVIALVGDTCGGSASTPPPPSETSESTATSGVSHTFLAGSLIIPMDTSYQDAGMLRAYGLVDALLRADVAVSWVVRKNKNGGEADFAASATDFANPATVITGHGYRSGPFVVDSIDAARATSTITAYLMANPQVRVHRATTAFDGFVRRQLLGAPRFALMRDGGETVARAYLAAAGISDSQGGAWLDASPDVLTPAQLAGAANNVIDGALFDGSGTTHFCGLLSTGWPTASGATAQGQEIVREVRAMLLEPTSLVAQGSSVLAFESTGGGRYLTRDGYSAGATPTSLFELNTDSPFAQIDGALTASGGAVGALSLAMLDGYKDNDAVIYGSQGASPGEADLWVTARLDGECSILDDTCESGQALGLVSYLAGGAYSTTTPISGNAGTNGVRLILNALFAADCATREQRPAPTALITGPSATTTAQNTYTIAYDNDGSGIAYAATLEYPIPAGASFVSATGGGVLSAGVVRWNLGSLDLGEAGSVDVTISYGAHGSFANQATVRYGHGNTRRSAASWVLTTSYTSSTDLQCTALGINEVNVPPTNETQGSAYNLGELSGRIYRATGSTAGMAASYTSGDLGTCGPASGSPDAAFHFRLSQPANVTLSTEGTGWDTVLGLYNGNVAPSDSIAATNTAETTSTAQSLGVVNGRRVTVGSGNTNGMAPDYNADEIGCGANAGSPDAVYSFTLSAPTTVRMSTAGSSFNTVMSLHNDGIVQVNPATTHAIPATNSAFHNAHVMGFPANDHDQTYTSTIPAPLFNNTIEGNFHLPSTCYSGSGYATNAPDVVFQFEVERTGSYRLDTTGSGFDTVLAVYDSMPRFTNMNPISVPEDSDEAYTGTFPNGPFPMGSVTASYFHIQGDTNNNVNGWTANNCNANPGARDAFAEFSVTGAANRTITIDTVSSDFNTVLLLYRYTNAAKTTYTYVNCNDDHSGSTTSRIQASLTPGDYFAVVTGRNATAQGNYQLRVQDGTRSANPVACNDDPPSGGSRAIIPAVTLQAGQTYYAILKQYANNSGLFGSLVSNPYQLQLRDNNLATTGNPNRIDCNDNHGASQQSQITRTLPAGTYYVVVKGAAATDRGSYTLVVEDVDAPPVGSILECDDNDGPGNTSMIQRALPAGDYWVVLKGKGATDAGDYSLRVVDDSAAVGTILECNNDGGINGTSVIERDLTPGTYYVIVKGDNAAEAGAYKLAVTDVTNLSNRLVACDNDGGGALTSRINRDLSPGTYYAVVKGRAANSAGAYTLTVQDTANSPLGAIACNDDGGTYKTSVISRTLNAGTYYVALKGYNANEQGPYQLTIGGGSTSSAFYVPPTWSQTLSALTQRGVRVIPIISCRDDPHHGNAQGDCNRVRSQAITLANSTGALGVNLQPLMFDINRNGEGLSRSVVDGVASLAEYLEMDVRAIVKFDPDANPGFLVNIVAIDEVGDGCSGLLGNEHKNCAPGARPRFHLEITNPLPGVPRHPTDPNGGYTFRAQLIGDGQFIVEEVPLYIIPESLAPMGPQEPPIYEEGSYWQDAASPGCANFNQLPDWRDLSWHAEVYPNTTVEFLACTATTQAALNDCTPKQIAEVTGAGECAADSDCTVGYCDTGIGVCQVARGSMCTADNQCLGNSYCDQNIGRCTYLSQPVYIGGALGSDNFQRFIRMTVRMRVTQPFENPPVLHRWDMTYYCNNSL